MTSNNRPTNAPPPWVNIGEAYLFMLSTPEEIPEGGYAPLEAKSYFASPEAGKFRGGRLGSTTVQVMRYTDTPAGPYDELIYIPGHFDNPSSKAQPRITRIYVSTAESIYNGRKNWNIPKHIARFTFTPIQPDKGHSPIKIEVFPPSPTSLPFFSAIATPSKWIPSFPFSSVYLPVDSLLVHPPLPSHPDSYSEVGTEQWVSILPVMKGKAEIVWYKPDKGGRDCVQPGEYADGVGFPKFKPWRFGIHLTNLVLELPEGLNIKDKTI